LLTLHPLAEPTALAQLVSLYHRPLQHIHTAWRDPLLSLTTILLELVYNFLLDEPLISHHASAAFLLLPGLIATTQHRRLTSVVHMLRLFCDDPDPSKAILEVALRFRPPPLPPRVPSGATRPPSLQRLRASVNKLATHGRTRPAMRALERMARLFAAGNHSSLMVMEPPPLSLSDSKTILAHLNPPASALDALPLPLLPLPPQLQLSTTDVFEAMQSLDPKSSHGWTGWTFHVMKSLFLTDYSEVHNLKSSALACITALFNAILLGYPPSDLWLVSRAVLIPKEKGGYRPLGIGESWYRCISRAIMRIVGAPTGLLLHPTQLGVGTPSGCEIAGRIPQMLFDSRPDSCAILLDLENAFNRMRRGLIWNATESCLLPLGLWGTL